MKIKPHQFRQMADQIDRLRACSLVAIAALFNPDVNEEGTFFSTRRVIKEQNQKTESDYDRVLSSLCK